MERRIGAKLNAIRKRFPVGSLWYDTLYGSLMIITGHRIGDNGSIAITRSYFRPVGCDFMDYFIDSSEIAMKAKLISE